jgi:hypothetical protein
MSNSAAQNLKNHRRMDPPFHYVLLPVLLANLVIAIVCLAQHPGFCTAWLVVLSVAVFAALFRLRTYPLKVQDRVIRIEERLRLQSLAPREWQKEILRLSEDQLIGLRFASDDEVVELARQALEGNLNREQIKERIGNWRPDNWRV